MAISKLAGAANAKIVFQVSYGDLSVPDRYCSKDSGNDDEGGTCPGDMECKRLKLNSKQRGCTGFDNIVFSVKTVYEAASQEGWVYLMYNTTDAYPAWSRLLLLDEYFFLTILNSL